MTHSVAEYGYVRSMHRIDEGIDTGAVLAYAPVAPLFLGEDYPALFVRTTQQGVDRLIETLTRLAAGEQWVVPTLGNRVSIVLPCQDRSSRPCASGSPFNGWQKEKGPCARVRWQSDYA